MINELLLLLGLISIGLYFLGAFNTPKKRSTRIRKKHPILLLNKAKMKRKLK